MKRYFSNRNILYGLLLITLSFLSCDEVSNQEQFDQIVSLLAGEHMYIQEKGFTIGFTKILEDSRCPTDADCIWEGNGKIQIFTTKFMTDSTYFELNTTLDPKIIEYFGCNIELIELEPYPSVEEIIDPMEYVCTLKIQEF